jgi:hypothetical protein
MDHTQGGMDQSSLCIFRFEIRKLLQDLLNGQAGGKEIQDVDDADAGSA